MRFINFSLSSRLRIGLLFFLLVLTGRTSFGQHGHGGGGEGLPLFCIPVLRLPPFVDALPIPSKAVPARTNANYTVPAAPSLSYQNIPEYDMPMTPLMHQFHSSLPAVEVWGYDGKYPGPTFDVIDSEPILVNWSNNLPATYPIWLTANENLHGVEDQTVRTVVHLHGGSSLPRYDGYPTNYYGRGQSDQYFYGNIDLNHTGQTLWYHDHAIGVTANNVYAGLAGFYLLRNPAFETNLNLPSGKYEIPLVIQDRDIQTNCPPASLLIHNQVTFHNLVTVNGKVTPYLEVEPRKYRFRLLNGAGSRTFGLSMGLTDTSGRSTSTNAPPPFTVIGTEDGFMRQATNLNSLSIDSPPLVLMPGERLDLIIDFSGFAHTNITMQSNGQFGNPIGTPRITNIMQFRVNLPLSSPDSSSIPPGVIVTNWTDVSTMMSRAVSTQQVVLDVNSLQLFPGAPFTYGGLYPIALMNLKFFHDPITERTHAGDTEVWNIVNLSGEPHPIHIHLLDFRVVRRIRFAGYFTNAQGNIDLRQFPTMVVQYNSDRTNGTLKDIWHYLSTKPADSSAPRPFEDGPKDVVHVGPFTMTQVVMKWPMNQLYYTTPSGSSLGSDTLGRYIYHCRILEHEDNDMMRPFQLLAPYQPTMRAVPDGTVNPSGANHFSLVFETRARESYQIESATDLTSPSWERVSEIEGTGEPVTVPPPPATDQARYYKLRRLDLP